MLSALDGNIEEWGSIENWKLRKNAWRSECGQTVADLNVFIYMISEIFFLSILAYNYKRNEIIHGQ